MIVILHSKPNFCIPICHEILSYSICPLTYVCFILGTDTKPSTVESKIQELLSKERGGGAGEEGRREREKEGKDDGGRGGQEGEEEREILEVEGKGSSP